MKLKIILMIFVFSSYGNEDRIKRLELEVKYLKQKIGHNQSGLRVRDMKGGQLKGRDIANAPQLSSSQLAELKANIKVLKERTANRDKVLKEIMNEEYMK